MRWLALVAVICALTAQLVESKSYSNYKLYRAHPANIKQSNVLNELQKSHLYDFWTKGTAVGRDVDVMVQPKRQNIFEALLKHNGIKYEVLIEDVEKIVQEEQLRQKQAKPYQNGTISFDKYNRYEEIISFITEVQRKYPNLVSLVTYGQSYEGRDLKLLEISTGGEAKPTIFIDGGVHAREWISPAVALYIIDQLLNNQSENGDLLRDIDWVISPLINPDGYEYTHVTDRFWRKTRSGSSGSCMGVDMNRNFGFHWNEIGASDDPCDADYSGSKAFSEVESAALAKYLEKNGDNIKLYIALHSYGQYILYPYGYTSTPAENKDELEAAANSAATAIEEVDGTSYTVGSTWEALYPNSGSSRDWCHGSLAIPLSYTIELPGGGSRGFDLPPESIDKVVKETFEGIRAFHNFVKSSYAPKK